MISRTSADMVASFHRAFDHPIGDRPAPISDERLRLRLRLILEETAELVCAMIGADDTLRRAIKRDYANRADYLYSLRGSRQDIVEVADACCDVHYVVSGTALEYGIPEDLVYREVHHANMRKVGGPQRPDGKTLRPEGWTPPDIETILRAAGWEG